MDFIIGLPVLTNERGETYDSILVIINKFSKIVYCKLVKIIIDALILFDIIIKVVLWHHTLMNSIVNDWDIVFILKFRFWLYYFLGIK